MSCFVGKPPTLRALQGKRSAVGIVYAKLFTVAVPEIELVQIAMQVGFADVLIHAVHAAFEDREEAFDGIGGDDPFALAAYVFVRSVFDGSVRGKVPADAGEHATFIGHEIAFRRSVAAQDRVNVLAAHGRHVERPDAAVPLDQREDRIHMAVAVADFGFGLAADIGEIRLKGLALAAHRRANAILGGLHDLADAVGEEPSGFHAALEGPLNLAGADPLLAGVDELDRLQPQMQWEVAVLKDAADPHGEGLPAGVALAEARTAALAG